MVSENVTKLRFVLLKSNCLVILLPAITGLPEVTCGLSGPACEVINNSRAKHAANFWT